MLNINEKAFKTAKNKRSTWFLYFISFIESIFFPIPTDIFIIPIALTNKNKVLLITFMTTLFSVLGGIIGYLIGLYFFNEVGKELIGYYSLQEEFNFFTNLITEYGYIFIFIAGFTPLPYKIAAIASGFINMPILIFILSSFFSRGLRFFIVTYISSKVGINAEKIIRKNFLYISIFLFSLVLILMWFELAK